jgi:CrcB protein
VAIGGAIGACARYATGLVAASIFGKGFPWGTLVVNVAGCLAMGGVLKIMADLEAQPPEGTTPNIRSQLAFWHKAVAIGFLGGLTTFSSFGADTLRELQGGRAGAALANIAANVVLLLAAVWFGMALAQAIDLLSRGVAANPMPSLRDQTAIVIASESAGRYFLPICQLNGISP